MAGKRSFYKRHKAKQTNNMDTKKAPNSPTWPEKSAEAKATEEPPSKNVPKRSEELKVKESALLLAPAGTNPHPEEKPYGTVGYENSDWITETTLVACELKAAIDCLAKPEDESRFELPVFPDEDPRDDYCKALDKLRDTVSKMVPGGEARLEVRLALRNWPNVPNPVTYAPLVMLDSFKSYKITQGNVNASHGLFNLGAELGAKIIGYMEGHRNLANFSQTCTAAFQLVTNHMIHWDLTTGRFPTDRLRGRRCDKIIAISKGRAPQANTARESFLRTMQCMEKLMKHGQAIEMLHLHELEYLNAELVRSIMVSCPNLQFIGVYQCRQLDLFTAETLIKYTAEVLDHRRGQKNDKPLKLDFGPVFYSGPNTYLREGSFGVFWNDPGFNPAAGILQLLDEIYEPAKKIGIDLLEPGTALRHFLSRCPLPHKFTERSHAIVLMRQYRLERAAGVKNPWLRKQLVVEANSLYHDDAVTTVFGGRMAPETVPAEVLRQLVRVRNPEMVTIEDQAREWQWWRKIARCNMCQKDIAYWKLPFAKGSCWRCRCQIHQEEHEDAHLGDYFRSASRYLLADAPVTVKLPTLADILVDEKDPRYMMRVNIIAAIDYVHSFDMANAQNGSTAKPRSLNPRMDSIVHRQRMTHQSHGPVDRIKCDRQYRHPGKHSLMMTDSFITAAYGSELDQNGISRNEQNYRDRNCIISLNGQIKDLGDPPNADPSSNCWYTIQLRCCTIMTEKVAGDEFIPYGFWAASEFRDARISGDVLKKMLGHPDKTLNRPRGRSQW